jgi:hypothetical protein
MQLRRLSNNEASSDDLAAAFAANLGEYYARHFEAET